MAGCRIIYDGHGRLAEYDGEGNLVFLREGAGNGTKGAAPYVIRDIEPYKSMITGEMITSRSYHRDHLRAHNCIEVGNETMKSEPVKTVSKNKRRELLHRQLADKSDRQVKKMAKEYARNAIMTFRE